MFIGMRLSIVVPCYNEKENLPLLLEAFNNVLMDYPIEVIIVDNGSTDGSSEIIRDLIPEYEFARTIRIEKNQGYGYGILQGLKVAEGDYLGWTHADLQTDPADIVKAYKIIKKYNSKNLFIKGVRGKRPFFDIVFTAGMSVFESIYFRENLYDINAQPNVFPSWFYAKWKEAPYDFSLELYALIQARELELEVHRFKVEFAERIHGESSWNTGIPGKFKMIQRTLLFSYKLKHPERKTEMKKKKSIIFGSAGTGKKIYEKIKDKEEVIAFSDNDESKWGGISKK